jgi:O-antigen/teichoic acid export membrane protein
MIMLYIAAIHSARIPYLVSIMSGAPLMAMIGNAISLYWLRRPDLRPNPLMFRPTVALLMLRRGVMFFGNGIASAMAYDSQLIIIAHLLGPAAVGVYAVVQRLFSILSQLVNYTTLPLWPAFSEALAIKDIAWIRRALNRGLILNTLLISIPAIGFALFGQQIIFRWTHGAIHPSHTLILGFCFWAVLFGLNCPQSMILNAAHVLTFQLLGSLSFGVATVVGMLFLLPRLGLTGASWIMVVAYLTCMVLPMTLYIRFRFLNVLSAEAVVVDLLQSR